MNLITASLKNLEVKRFDLIIGQIIDSTVSNLFNCLLTVWTNTQVYLGETVSNNLHNHTLIFFLSNSVDFTNKMIILKNIPNF